MNYIVQDNEIGVTLYGIVLLKEIKRTNKSANVKIYRVPAEVWIAFLKFRYRQVPAVTAYLRAVENGGGINPGEGALLEAIDQELEIPLEEWEYALELIRDEPDDHE
jgi:hypothetical protein